MQIKQITKDDVSLIENEVKQCINCLRGIKRFSTHQRDDFILITKEVFDDFIDKFVAPSLLDKQYEVKDRENYAQNIKTIAEFCHEKYATKLDSFGVNSKKVNSNTDKQSQVNELRKGIKKAVGKLGVFHKATGTLQIPALVGSMHAILQSAGTEIKLDV